VLLTSRLRGGARRPRPAPAAAARHPPALRRRRQRGARARRQPTRRRRPRMRHARAGRRARRLFRRLPRRRPRHEDVLVERYATLGGVCLNVGCIPSKALLHVGRGDGRGEPLRIPWGVSFGKPRDRSRQAQGPTRTRWWASSPAGLTAIGQGCGKGDDPCAASAPSWTPTTWKCRRPRGSGSEVTGKKQESASKNCDNRRRLAGGAAALHAQRDPARGGLPHHGALEAWRPTPSAC
jgi:hypothetical protein